MILFHDSSCARYGSPLRPEQPARITQTVPLLQANHKAWEWRPPLEVAETTLLLAHAPALLARLQHGPDIDDDTPYFPGIYDHARRAVGAALGASAAAQTGQRAFALMRPPGHHCTRDRAMGFCYLNQIAIAALQAAATGQRVAVWDFDVHHGNGTEAILARRPNLLFVSVHQHPAYPGTGTHSFDNCQNFPVPPGATRETHLAALAQSWETVLNFRPDLVLVSAGFDAYARDPLAQMQLERPDFVKLGSWLRESGLPVGGGLEGGYSADLPLLIDDFLSAWDNSPPLSL